MRISLIAACILSLCLANPVEAKLKAAPVEAAFAQPMNVSIVRALTVAGCEPDCDEWIAMQGRIEPDTPALLRKALKQMGARKLPVLIHSPGGSVEAALAMGKMIREAGLKISVSRTRYVPACQPENRPCDRAGRDVVLRGEPDDYLAFCGSACPLVLAGGVERYVPYGAFVGVHQVVSFVTRVTFHRVYRVLQRREGNRTYEVSRRLVRENTTRNTVKLKKAPDSVNDKIARYFKGMGVGDGLMTKLLKTPNSGVYYLTREELVETAIATNRVGAEAMFASLRPKPVVAIAPLPPTASLAADVVSGPDILRPYPVGPLPFKFEVASAGPPPDLTITDFVQLGAFQGRNYLAFVKFAAEPGQWPLKFSIELFDGEDMVPTRFLELLMTFPRGETIHALPGDAAQPNGPLVAEISPTLICGMELTGPIQLSVANLVQATGQTGLDVALAPQNWRPLLKLREALCQS